MIGRFRSRRKRELDEEIRTHFEMAVAERVDRGETRREAERAVRLEFGHVDSVKEATSAEWGWAWVGRRSQDVCFALRGMRRSPGFACSALVILALGIGANTALFSVVKAVFLQAPPVANADRIVTIYTTCRRGAPRCSTSYPDYLDYRDRTRMLDDLAVATAMSVNLGDGGEMPLLADATLVSGNYFDVLGVGPYVGRLIQPADDEVGAPAEVAVLSHATWTTRFAADPSIVGRTVGINGISFEIVGVTPAGFRGTTLTDAPDLFVPLTTSSRLQAPPGVPERIAQIAELDRFLFTARNVRWMDRLVGRLTSAATPDQARQELLAVSEALRAEDPDARGPRSITLDPSHRYTLPEQSHDELSRYILLVGVVVGLMLVLACANVANLLLARGAARGREIAMRRALGANRARVVGQLLTESVVLSLVGGAIGVGLAPVLVWALSRATLPGGVELGRLDLGLDLPTLAFALMLAVGTSAVFGLAPALRGGSVALLAVVKGENSPHSLAGNRLRKVLIAVQTGLCILLLVGSGLFVQTVRNGLAHDAGFDPRDLALLRFNLQPLGLSPAAGLDALSRLRTRAAAVPGVLSAAIVTRAPLGPGGRGIFFEVPGYSRAPDEELRLEWVGGTPGMLSTLGIRLEAGSDSLGGASGRVWINETMAQRYFPDGAIGRRVSMLDGEFTVAGVFADVDWDRIGEETINNAIVPLASVPDRESSTAVSTPVTLAVKLDRPIALSLLQDEVRAIFPGVTFLDTQPATDLVESQLAPQRLAASLLSGMGALALTLAGLGIAGVVTYLVNQRRRDIGVRIALGAPRRRVVGALVAEMAVPILAGALIGAGASVVLGRAAQSFLFGIAPGDPGTQAGAVLVLALTGVVAVLPPARRAAMLDPMRVLRED